MPAAARTLLFLLVVLAFPGCGRKNGTGGGGAAPAAAVREGGAPGALDAGFSPADPALWEHARSHDPLDLLALAEAEGPRGLVLAAAQPERRKTSLAAMVYLRGFAHLPFAADVAATGTDEEAEMVLASAKEAGNRAVFSEDREDYDELRLGCAGFASIAAAKDRPRARRVLALSALRALPCSPPGPSADLDAK